MNTQIDAHWTHYYGQGKDFGLITSQALTSVLSNIETNTKKVCLDIGCGTGQLTRELFHRGYECVGVDISSKAIETAKNHTGTPTLHYLHFDIENDDVSTLPLQPYSLITCKLVFAFIKNKDNFIDNVRFVMAKGGSFVIITPTYKESSDTKPIAVDYEATLKLLDGTFKKVSTFELTDGLTCYVCR